MPANTTTYRRPSVSIGMGLDGADYSYLTKADEEGGFFIQFNVPFKRDDVFKELLNDDNPLGSDGDHGATFVILKPGREAGKLVSTGCVRECNYGAPVWGRTITELREIKPPTYIRWSTLMQEGTLFHYMGKADEVPKLQIALKELKKNSGTAVTMKLDFLEVSFNGPLCCLSFLAEPLLKSSMQSKLPELWTTSMLRRGYDRADKKGGKKGGNKKTLADEMAKNRQGQLNV